MKILQIFALVCAMCILGVSCHNEAETTTSSAVENVEVCISLPVDATRTAIDDDGKRTRWAEGDELAVWANDSAGNSIFSNATFMLRYFSTEWDKAYFVGNIAEMPEGDYAYYMSYPRPLSVDGTMATFRVAADQSGMYDGKYDIMVADPTLYGSLTTGEAIELNTVMRHQMHALKITVPEKASNFDNKVYALDITFPTAVVGDITIDVTNPDAKPVYTNTSNTISVKSTEGFAVGSDIWVFVLPGTVSGDVSYEIKGSVQRSEVATYPLEREFERGHVTPIRIAMPPFKKITIFNFSIGENYLGEDFNFFTLYDNNGTNMGTFNRNAENLYKFEYEGEFDVAPYNNKEWTLVFDSENAVVENKVNMGTLKPYIEQDIAPVDVPYLLFEDFNDASDSESYGNNSYSSSEREQPGVALSGSLAGWNAARYWIKPGAARVNARFQAVSAAFTSYHYGRLDTPPLGNGTRGLKSTANVDIAVSFDAAYYVLDGSSMTVNSTSLCMTAHTNHSNPIDGIPVGVKGLSWSGIQNYDTTLDDFGSVLFRAESMKGVGSEAFGDVYTPFSTEVKVPYNARLCFYPTMSVTTEAISIGNCETSVYIDNIKVSIAK